MGRRNTYGRATSATAAPGRRGFTLVELLVVIGIIALLIGILMPTLNRARRMGIRAACLSNMRETGNGIQMYLNENKLMMPPALANFAATTLVDFGDETVYEKFPNVLGSSLPYAGDRRVFACPGIDPETVHPWWGMGVTPLSDTNYCVNGVVLGRKVSAIKHSSDLVLLQEYKYRDRFLNQRPGRGAPGGEFTWWHGHTAAPDQKEEYSSVHEGGGNLLFLDGHAEWRHHRAIRARDFGLTGGPSLSGKADDAWDTVNNVTYQPAF